MGNSSSSNEQQSVDNNEDINTHVSNEEEQEEYSDSYWGRLQFGYNALVNAIIRPPRCDYDLNMLGPKSFEFCGKSIQRNDFELINNRGLTIKCSLWSLTNQKDIPNPCVIYMHGNSSARVEGLSSLSIVLSIGSSFLSFDFCGSGQSDGEWVSLGAFEKDDLKCVIEYLRSENKASTIALWGRSMGAATALLHGERDPSIAGMVLDSTFSSLETIAEELVEKGRQKGLFAPSFLVSIAIRFIRSTILKKAEFDIKDLNPINCADKCFIPALFIAGEEDDFIPPSHSEKIHNLYAGDKNIIIVEGNHNSLRPRFMLDSVSIFLIHCLQISANDISPAQQYFGQLPWKKIGSNSFFRSSTSPNTSPIDKKTNNSNNSNNNKTVDNNDINLDAIGMTKERQKEIENKLFNMLGDSNTKSNPKSINQPPPSSSPPLILLNNIDINGEWTCQICTLINTSNNNYCTVCSTKK